MTCALGALMCVSFAAAQGTGAKTGAPKPMQMTSPKAKVAPVYACPKCEMASKKGGKCPGCSAKMEKIHAKVGYACDKCHVMAAKAGKCPKCGTMMKHVADTFACDKCHVTAMKAGKCPKCGQAMKEHSMPMMGG